MMNEPREVGPTYCTGEVPEQTPGNRPRRGWRGRGLAKGKPAPNKTRPGHRSRTDALSALERVRQAASKDKEMRFTALLQTTSTTWKRPAHWPTIKLKKESRAPVVDGEDVAGTNG